MLLFLVVCTDWMVLFFGDVSLDGWFYTLEDIWDDLVGKLWWPECYKFDIKMSKNPYWYFGGFSDFEIKYPCFFSKENRPNNRFLGRCSQDRHHGKPRNLFRTSHNWVMVATTSQIWQKMPYYIIGIFVFKPWHWLP